MVSLRRLLLWSCFELAQCRHGGRGGVFAVAVFWASFGLARVMSLSHIASCWIGGWGRLP
jgi:hypothetical protein